MNLSLANPDGRNLGIILCAEIHIYFHEKKQGWIWVIILQTNIYHNSKKM